MNGRYRWCESGRHIGDEVIDINKGLDGVLARFMRYAPDGSSLLAVSARFDDSWRIGSMKLEQGGRSASYGWDEDSWVGSIGGGAARQVAIPMVGDLDADCPSALFDFVFLMRAALPPLSQRRIELLRVQPQTLETEQTYQIVERLPDAELPWDSVRLPMRRYRLTDDAGRQELLWTREDGLCLRRAAADGTEDRYRLVEGLKAA